MEIYFPLHPHKIISAISTRGHLKMWEIYCEQSNFDLLLLVVHPSHISSHQHQRRHHKVKAAANVGVPFRWCSPVRWNSYWTATVRPHTDWVPMARRIDLLQQQSSIAGHFSINLHEHKRIVCCCYSTREREKFSYSYAVTIKDDLGTLNPDPNCLWWETGCVHLLFSDLESVLLVFIFRGN